MRLDGDPVEHLLESAAGAIALRDALGQMVNDLPSLTPRVNGLEYPHPLVAMFERARVQAQRELHDLARFGLDDRAVALSESQGRLMAGGLSWFLGQLGVRDDLDALALIDTMLMALAAGHLPHSAAGLTGS